MFKSELWTHSTPTVLSNCGTASLWRCKLSIFLNWFLKRGVTFVLISEGWGHFCADFWSVGSLLCWFLKRGGHFYEDTVTAELSVVFRWLKINWSKIFLTADIFCFSNSSHERLDSFHNSKLINLIIPIKLLYMPALKANSIVKMITFNCILSYCKQFIWWSLMVQEFLSLCNVIIRICGYIISYLRLIFENHNLICAHFVYLHSL